MFSLLHQHIHQLILLVTKLIGTYLLKASNLKIAGQMQQFIKVAIQLLMVVMYMLLKQIIQILNQQLILQTGKCLQLDLNSKVIGQH
jgi:hypothetical protein